MENIFYTDYYIDAMLNYKLKMINVEIMLASLKQELHTVKDCQLRTTVRESFVLINKYQQISNNNNNDLGHTN